MVDVRVEQVIVFLFVLFCFCIWNFKGSKVDEEPRELLFANVNVLDSKFVCSLLHSDKLFFLLFWLSSYM